VTVLPFERIGWHPHHRYGLQSLVGRQCQSACMWAQEAVDGNFRTRWSEKFQEFWALWARGLVTGPGRAAFGSSTGNIVNCPIVHRFL
jgi:hypothetical protein